MSELLEQLAADPWGRLILQFLVTGGMQNCFLFLLIFARLTGLFVLAPFGATTLVPWPVRVGLAILLSLVLVPVVSVMVPTESDVAPVAHQSLAATVDMVPESVPELLFLLISEIGVGTLLGVGVLTVLNGFRLGGEWLDRHSGFGMGSIMDPGWSAGGSATGQMIPLLGLAAFLVMEPLGGQSLLLRSLAESFQAIPLGSAAWSTAAIELLNGLVQQSFLLGIRVALPLVITMLSVDLTIALAGRNTPLTLSPAVLAAKAGIGLFVLAMTLTTLPDVISATILSLFSLSAA